MSYVTVDVEIDNGRIVPREPEKLPEKAAGLLTILLPSGWPPGYFEKTVGALVNEPLGAACTVALRRMRGVAMA